MVVKSLAHDIAAVNDKLCLKMFGRNAINVSKFRNLSMNANVLVALDGSNVPRPTDEDYAAIP